MRLNPMCEDDDDFERDQKEHTNKSKCYFKDEDNMLHQKILKKKKSYLNDSDNISPQESEFEICSISLSESETIPLKGKVILAIGQSGIGKTIFLNELANIIENNQLENLKTYFEQEKNPKISEGVKKILDERIQRKSSHKILHTKSINIIEISQHKTGRIFTLIDTPGIINEIDGTPDSQYISQMENLFKIVKKIDFLILLKSSVSQSLFKSTENTILQLSKHFDQKVARVIPVFTLCCGYFEFNKESLPFPIELISDKVFKINYMISGYIAHKKYAKPSKKQQVYEKSKRKIGKIINYMDSLK